MTSSGKMFLHTSLVWYSICTHVKLRLEPSLSCLGVWALELVNCYSEVRGQDLSVATGNSFQHSIVDEDILLLKIENILYMNTQNMTKLEIYYMCP